jgi:hypothetical protein
MYLIVQNCTFKNIKFLVVHNLPQFEKQNIVFLQCPGDTENTHFGKWM